MLIVAFLAEAHAGAYEVLRLRDGADCSRLGAGDAVRDELVALAEADVQPPWVPIRAASCLVAGWAADPVFVDRAEAWVTEARWAGLGLVVADGIDTFGLEDGVGIARAAAAGPDPRTRKRIARRISRSERPEIRAAVEGVDEAPQGR